ncbi:ferritin-like domain-containing protein [Spelaeicoccus albus]
MAFLACGELNAFERTATDSRFAPTISDRVELAGHAVTEWRHYELVAGRLTERGVDVNAAMSVYEAPLQTFHDRTRPRDWYESLMKAYVSDGMVNDFYRAFAAHLDPSTRELIERVLGQTGHSAFIVDRLRLAIADDNRLGGRLALWGRRLVGEALSQAGHAAERGGPGMMELLGDDNQQAGAGEESGASSGAAPDEPGARISRIFAMMTEEHSRRMMALGLSA